MASAEIASKTGKSSKKGGKKKLEQIIETPEVALEDSDSDDGSSRRKRGRKPKDKFKFDSLGMLDGQAKEMEENIIVKLPLSCLQLSNEMMPTDGMTYNPTLTIPEPYDKPHPNFADLDSLSITKGENIALSSKFSNNENVALCAKCSISIRGGNTADTTTGLTGLAENIENDGTRQIDIILNNKYGCNAEKIQVLAQICSTVLENKWPTSVDIA